MVVRADARRADRVVPVRHAHTVPVRPPARRERASAGAAVTRRTGHPVMDLAPTTDRRPSARVRAAHAVGRDRPVRIPPDLAATTALDPDRDQGLAPVQVLANARGRHATSGHSTGHDRSTARQPSTAGRAPAQVRVLPTRPVHPDRRTDPTDPTSTDPPARVARVDLDGVAATTGVLALVDPPTADRRVRRSDPPTSDRPCRRRISSVRTRS